MPFRHIWSCDSCLATRSFIQENFSPHKLFEDVTKRGEAALPAVNAYVAGFPCTPFSMLHSNSATWDEPAAAAGLSVLQTVQKKRPALVVLENVLGLRKRKDAWQEFIQKLREFLTGYDIFVLNLCPTDLGHCVRRPRLYIVCVRQDVSQLDDNVRKEQFISLLMEEAAKHLQTEGNRAEDWSSIFGASSMCVTDEDPCTRDSAQFADEVDDQQTVVYHQINRGNSQGLCKWQVCHQEIRAQHRLPLDEVFPIISGLTPREQDVWNLVRQMNPSAATLAADVSQSANRLPVRSDGTIPVVTPGSKIVLMAPHLLRVVTGKDKLLAAEAPVDSFVLPPGTGDRQLGRWGGNTMSLRCVSVAWLVGILMVDWAKARAQKRITKQCEAPCCIYEAGYNSKESRWTCNPMSSGLDQVLCQAAVPHGAAPAKTTAVERRRAAPAKTAAVVRRRAAQAKSDRSSRGLSSARRDRSSRAPKRSLEEKITAFQEPTPKCCRTVEDRLNLVSEMIFGTPYSLEKVLAGI